MISSAAVTAVPARVDIGAAAEAPTPNSERPRAGAATPGGARKTVPSYNALKEYQSHVRPYQQRRHRDLSHVVDVGQEGQGLPRARQGQQEVTAAPAERRIVDMSTALYHLEAEIAQVLQRHGLFNADRVSVDTRCLRTEDNLLTGLVITVFGRPVLERPHCPEDDAFNAIVAPLKEES